MHYCLPIGQFVKNYKTRQFSSVQLRRYVYDALRFVQQSTLLVSTAPIVYSIRRDISECTL